MVEVDTVDVVVVVAEAADGPRRRRPGRWGDQEQSVPHPGGGEVVVACTDARLLLTAPVVGFRPARSPSRRWSRPGRRRRSAAPPPADELHKKRSPAGDDVACTAMIPLRQGRYTVVPCTAMPPSMSSPQASASEPAGSDPPQGGPVEQVHDPCLARPHHWPSERRAGAVDMSRSRELSVAHEAGAKYCSRPARILLVSGDLGILSFATNPATTVDDQRRLA